MSIQKNGTDQTLDPSEAPIFERLVEHNASNSASFHVPGHKSGFGVDPTAAPYMKNIMSIDLTEITGLDDLHQPEGVIRKAQQLAADCFGAEETYFLVGGSTVGNLAMIASTCGRGDLLLVQRNVHKSVLHGLMLAGAQAVFLPPRWDAESGIATGVELEDVTRALKSYPEAKGLLLSNPNYYGMGIHLQAIADYMHSVNKPLLVDEAHGAHYGFHPELPLSALHCGADAVVQSTHKMLTAMTMGAMLHLQGDLIQRAAVKQCLSMLQSSSPSYPLLASLDLARRQMHIDGTGQLEKGLQAVHYFTAQLEKLPCFQRITIGPNTTAYETEDPFKISICDTTGALSGSQLQQELERRGCFAEMANPRYILLLFTLASTREDAQRVIEALVNIRNEFELEKKELLGSITNINSIPQYTEISSPIAFTLQTFGRTRELQHSMLHTVSMQEAIGERSADMVIPYPPGIPILYPGEIITSSTAQYLQELSSAGTRFHGTATGLLESLTIL